MPLRQVPKALRRATVELEINGKPMRALLDTGSSHNFIHPSFVQTLGLAPEESSISESVTMASTDHSNGVSQFIRSNLSVNGRPYEKVKLKLLQNLCVDVILGNEFQEDHESVIFKFGGKLPPLEVCGLTTLNVKAPAPFANLKSDIKPITCKSRRYSDPDKQFIEKELQNFIKEGIIEPSNSS